MSGKSLLPRRGLGLSQTVGVGIRRQRFRQYSVKNVNGLNSRNQNQLQSCRDVTVGQISPCFSSRSGNRCFASQYRLFSTDGKKEDDKKEDDKKGSKEQEKEKKSDSKENAQEDEGGFFSSFSKKLEEEINKNEELKKSFSEVKDSMPFSAKNADENLNKTKKQMNDSYEDAKKASEESFEKMKGSETAKSAEETLEGAKQSFSSFWSEVGEELKKNIPAGDKKTSSKSSDTDDTSDQSKSQAGFFSGVSNKMKSASEGISGAAENVTSKLPENFGNDDKSWGDALRAVFGMKPKDLPKKSKESGKKEKKEWFEAKDDKTGEIYYYTEDGETVWEKPDELKTDEELAKDWAEHKKEPAEAKPSFYEKKIAALAQQISELEPVRDTAMGESDMAKVKEVNKEIKSLRKEIENLTAKANTNAMVVVEEKKGAWDQFGESLKDTPLLKGLFGMRSKIEETDAARKAREAAEDAREAWETSQNPWVYRAYSAYESVFAESEMGEVIREIRKLDPGFSFEDMIEEMEEEVIPTVIGAYLRGDVETTEKYCAEAAAAAIKASIEQRKAAGRKMDTNILDIEHVEIFAAKNIDKIGPVVFVQFMVQQIDCMYDLEGKVVDGKDDKVAAVFYMISVAREYDEEEMELKWGVKELAIIGQQPYT